MEKLRRGILALALAGLGAAGCSTYSDMRGETATFPVQISPSIPAAKAQVKVYPEKGQQRVKLEAKFLAPPHAVEQGANSYVVWLQPMDSDKPFNIGVLRVNESREGKFETTTPFRDFRVFVTAEETSSVMSPSEKPMMTASVRATNVTY
jgi:hypothetical protein